MREFRIEDYERVLGANLTESKIINERMESVYGTIRGMAKQKKKNIMKKRFFVGISAAAAMLILTVTISATNPTFAAKIPIINVIFKTSEQQISYKGNYSENAIQLADSETLENISEGSKVESPYTCTVEGVTVTAGEAYYNSEALYIGMHIYAKDGFPENFRLGCMVQDEYASIEMESMAKADLSASGQGILEFDPALGIETPNYMEGNFIDENNFSGIIRIPLESFGHVDKMGNFTKVTPPEKFVYSLCIKELYDNFESENKMIGPWNLTFDVCLDNKNTTVIEVNEKNENGIGISKVTKTLYEMKAELLLPEGANTSDYIVAMYDKDGNPLESQGSNAEVYSLHGKDVSEVTICIFDYVTYMDICKMKNKQEISGQYLFETKIAL